MITGAAFGATVVGMVMFIAGFMYLALGARDCQGNGNGRQRTGVAFMAVGVLIASTAAVIAGIAR